MNAVDRAASEARAAKGVGVVTTPENRWGRCDIKTVGLLPNALAKQKARAAGAAEAWFVDELGFVTGCLAPQSPVHTGPPIPGTTACYSTSYSMYFTPDLADYYRATGDLAFARQEFPIVQRELAWNASRVNSLGLLVTDTSDGKDWD